MLLTQTVAKYVNIPNIEENITTNYALTLVK